MVIVSCTTLDVVFSLVNYACFYRIIVDIIQLLNSKSWAVTFFRLVILSPKLKVRIPSVGLAGMIDPELHMSRLCGKLGTAFSFDSIIFS
jgi:hypothetical protein